MKHSNLSINCISVVSMLGLLLVPIISLAEIHHLTILHTNDHHGHFTKFSWNGIPDVGGMAARSTLVNIVRAEVEEAGGHVLLLSAGEVNIGTPESDLFYAEPDFKLMKMLGYDAMTLGNLEFSSPLEVLMQQQEWAGFPFLSANTVKKETGEPLFDSYIIKEFDSSSGNPDSRLENFQKSRLRIAILGLTQGFTPTIAALHADVLDSRSVIETAQALVPTLRAEADLVIALTHLGFHETAGGGYRTPGDMKLAKEVPGIDVIIGGQLQNRIRLETPELINNTLIVQAGEYGLYVGRLDLAIDSETDTITEYAYTLIPVNLKKQATYQEKSYYMFVDQGYVEDPAVLEFVQPYLDQVDELLSQPVGETLVRLDGERELLYAQETNLANLITDSMRAKTGAEIAFYNAGGIRASIEPGPITYRDILTVLPFKDTLVMMDMTGTQLMEVLNDAAMSLPGKGGVVHASGLRWTARKGIPEDVIVGGKPLELERIYKVVANDYIAAGGSHYGAFKGIPKYDTGFVDASALREYIMKLGTVAPKVEGRLTIIE